MNVMKQLEAAIALRDSTPSCCPALWLERAKAVQKLRISARGAK